MFQLYIDHSDFSSHAWMRAQVWRSSLRHPFFFGSLVVNSTPIISTMPRSISDTAIESPSSHGCQSPLYFLFLVAPRGSHLQQQTPC